MDYLKGFQGAFKGLSRGKHQITVTGATKDHDLVAAIMPGDARCDHQQRLRAIAHRNGFAHIEQRQNALEFRVQFLRQARLFRRETGLTPGAFRANPQAR